MIKILLYLPLHILNTWIAFLSPRWIFKLTYAPSSESVREQERVVRNKARLAAYHAKKYLL